jgi:hypothetical protein
MEVVVDAATRKILGAAIFTGVALTKKRGAPIL